jgi:hypothetical protein
MYAKLFCLRTGCCGLLWLCQQASSITSLFLLQVGDEVGADCSILGSVDDPSMPSQKATVIKQRFQACGAAHCVRGHSCAMCMLLAAMDDCDMQWVAAWG